MGILSLPEDYKVGKVYLIENFKPNQHLNSYKQKPHQTHYLTSKICFDIQFKAACGHGFGWKKQCTEAEVEEDFVDYCFEDEPFARILQVEGEHTCPFCIANPERYQDPE